MINSYDNLTDMPVITDQQMADELTAWQNSLLEPEVNNKKYEIQSQMLTPEEIAKKKNERLAKKNFELSDDTNFTIGAKELYNKVNNLWDGDDLKVNIGGKQYGTSNKIFEDVNATMEESLARRQELIDQYNSFEDDPNAKHKVYHLRLIDGYDENGNPLYVYKTGIAETSAAERYKNQYIRNGYEILSEKGFAGAEEWENKWHGLKANLENRTFDEGRNQFGKKISENDLIGAGYSEVYNTDAFGFNVDEQQLALNKQSSEALSKQKAERLAKGYGLGSDSMIDAFQAGLAKTVVDFGDTALDIVTPGDNTLLNEAKKQENIDSWVGYNRRSADKAIGEATNYFNQGKYASALWEVFKEPQILAESVPTMIEMTLGFGKFTKAGKLASELSAAQKAGNMEKATEISSKIANDLADANKAIYKVAQNAGFLSAVAQQTNNDLDERIANSNPSEGASLPEAMSVFASNFALLGLDRIAFDKITGIEGGKLALGKAFETTDAFGKKKILNGIANTAIGLAAAGSAEAAQEYVQTWGQILNQQLGTNENDGSFEKIISSKENIDEAIGGMLAGAAGGMHMKSISDTAEKALNIGTDIKNKTRADAMKRASQAFDPNYEFTESEEYLAKDDLIDASTERSRYKSALTEFAPRLYAESLFGKQKLMDSTGKQIDQETAFDAMLDSIKKFSFHYNTVEKEALDKLKASGYKDFDKDMAAEYDSLKNDYVENMMNVYETMAKQINKKDRNASEETKKLALKDIENKIIKKIQSEPDVAIKNMMFAEMINRFIETSTKDIFDSENLKTSKFGDVKQSVIYDNEKGSKYLENLKKAKQKIFGSLPPEELANLDSYKEITDKRNIFEKEYNDYQNKLTELQKDNKGITFEQAKTLLDSKSSYDVSREILDGSGFIVNPLRPSKQSIVGHMRNIRSSVHAIPTDNINSIMDKAKNNSAGIKALLNPISGLTKFANSRNRNNYAYNELLDKYTSGQITKQQFAKELVEQEDVYNLVRSKTIDDDISNDELTQKISRARSKGLPVYRIGLDVSGKIAERMIQEAEAFRTNLVATRNMLIHNIALLDAKANKLTSDGKIGLGNTIKNINSVSEEIKKKLEEVDSAINDQNGNIEHLNNVRKIFNGDTELSMLIKSEFNNSITKKRQDALSSSENKESVDSQKVEPAVAKKASVPNTFEPYMYTETDTSDIGYFEPKTDAESQAENIKQDFDSFDYQYDEQETEFDVGDNEPLNKTNTPEEKTNERRNETNDDTRNERSADETFNERAINEDEQRTNREKDQTSRDQKTETREQKDGASEKERNDSKTDPRVKKQIELLEEADKKIESEYDEIESEQDKIKEEIVKLKNELNLIYSEEKLSSYISNIKSIDNEISILEDNISMLENEIEDLKSILSTTSQKEIRNQKISSGFNPIGRAIVANKGEIKYKSKYKIKLENRITETKDKIEKLSKIVSKTPGSKKIDIKNKILDLENDLVKSEYGDSKILSIHNDITEQKKSINILKENGAGKSELARAKNKLKSLYRRFANEKYIDKVVRDAAIKAHSSILKSEKNDEETISKKTKANKIIDNLNELSLTPDLIKIVDGKILLNENLPASYAKNDKFPEFKDYYRMNKDVQGAVKVSEINNIYSAMSNNVVKKSEDRKTKILDNFYELKGDSYRNRIESEYPVGSDIRDNFENEIVAVFEYLLDSKFTDDKTGIRILSSKLDEDGNQLVNVDSDVLKSLDVVAYEVEDGAVKIKNKDGEYIQADDLSFNLLALIFGTKDTEVKRDGNKSNLSERTLLNIPSYVSNAIKLESWKSFGDMYKILEVNPYDDKQVEFFDSIWALDSNNEDIEEHRQIVIDEFVSQGKIPQAVVIRSLGQKIYDSLPIKLDKSIMKIYSEDEIVTQLGAYAVSQFKNGSKISTSEGTKRIERTDSEMVIDKNLQIIQMPIDDESVRTYRLVSDTLSYLNIEKEPKTPKFSPITKIPETIKNRKTKLSDVAIDTIREYQSVPYRFTNNVNEIYQLWKNPKTRENAYQYMNIANNEEDFKKMTISEVRKAISKNRNERIELDNMMRFYETAGQDKEFYLPWTFVSSGRYMDDSSVSLQRSKIVRFLVSTKGTRTEIEFAKQEDGSIQLEPGVVDGLYKTIAQAFDYGLDKDLDMFIVDEKVKKDIEIDSYGNIEFKNTSKGKMLKSAYDKILKARNLPSGSDEYIKVLTDATDDIRKINRKGISGEEEFEGFHAVQTVMELVNLTVNKDIAKTAIENGESSYKYDSHFSIESDGITSGMMITLSQIMTSDAISLLDKGGIYTEEARNFWTKVAETLGLEKYLDKLGKDNNGNQKITHGLLNRIGKLVNANKNGEDKKLEEAGFDEDEISKANFSDFYNTVARDVSSKIQGKILNLTSKLREVNEKIKKSNNEENIERLSAIANEHQVAIVILNFLQNKEITRSMAKDPVMVFIYGSSTNSIKNKILNGLLKNAIESELKRLSTSGSKDIDSNFTRILSEIGINRNDDGETFNITNDKIKLQMYDNSKKMLVEQDVSSYNRDSITFGMLGNIEITGEAVSGNKDSENNIQSRLRNASNISIGALFEDSFNDNFSFINDYRDVIKSLEVIRFSIFDQKFEEKVNQLVSENSSAEFTYNPTNEDLNKILQELINSGYGHAIKDINGGYHTFEKSEKVDSGNRTSIRTEDYSGDKVVDKTISGSIGITKEVMNLGAAPVTSIHNQDGWKIRYATLKRKVNEGIVNVFDATITGLKNHDLATFDYNEGYSKANTIHSILISQLVDLEKTISVLGSEGLAKVLEKAMDNDPIATKNIVNKMHENIISEQSSGKEYAEIKAYKETSYGQKEILLSAFEKFQTTTKNILSGLSNKIDNVAFGHMYSTDSAEQYIGSLGGFKIPNINVETIFNTYYDIMYAKISSIHGENTSNTKENPNFNYKVTNNLTDTEKAKIVSEVSSKLSGLDKSNKEKIMNIVNELINC